jgi:drug/metabolite transporter (DMT)-like permease
VTRSGEAPARTVALPHLEHKPNAIFIWGALVVVYLVWGSTYLAIRVAVRTTPPLLMASVRFLIAGGALYLVAIRRGDRSGDRPTWSQWRAATIIGGSLLLGGNGLVVIAEQRVTSSVAALLVAMVPLWMAVIGFAVYRERLSWPAVGGLVVGFAGVGVLVRPQGAARVDPAGVLMLVGATLSWAAGSLYARRAPLPKRPLVATAMEMIAGGVLLGVVGLARGELSSFHPGRVTAESLLAVGYLIVFGSLAGFTAYAWLIRVARTSIVSTYAYVNPIVAVFLGWTILNEPIAGRTLIAGLIIVIGVALIVTARAAAPGGVEPAGSPPDMPPST